MKLFNLRISAKTFLHLLLVCTIFASCRPEEVDPDFPVTFGIRHDKSLAEYETIATNQAPYNSEDYPDFAPIVMFEYSLDGSDNRDLVATGTLISPEWILTAGHNFFDSEEQTAPALLKGINVLVGDDPNNPVATYGVAELVFHPTWITSDGSYNLANDVCLVKLSTPITNIPPAGMATDNTEPIGGITWYCGYGDYSQQEGQDKDLFSKKHAIQNTLDRKIDGLNSGSGSSTFPGGLVAFDFDSPFNNVNTLGDDIINDDEAVLGAGGSDDSALPFEGTTVSGDSGGPLFIKIDGVWKIIGVLSGGASEPVADHKDSSYGDISIFMRVSSHKTWIESVVQ
ncbi:MAG: trypsin-like serine protease [Bacteroidia bacterium]